MILGAHILGIYYYCMSRASFRLTFQRTQKCVTSRVKLECEKEHQEQLLLSVIPAYIAAEVGETSLMSIMKQKQNRLKTLGFECEKYFL